MSDGLSHRVHGADRRANAVKQRVYVLFFNTPADRVVPVFTRIVPVMDQCLGRLRQLCFGCQHAHLYCPP